MLEVISYEGLSGIPQLSVLSFVVVAEKFKINIEATPRQVRAWHATWQAAQQMAQQTALKKTQARDSLTSEAKEIRSKEAAHSKPARRVAGATAILLVAFSAVLALLFRYAMLDEQSVSYDF